MTAQHAPGNRNMDNPAAPLPLPEPPGAPKDEGDGQQLSPRLAMLFRRFGDSPADRMFRSAVASYLAQRHT